MDELYRLFLQIARAQSADLPTAIAGPEGNQAQGPGTEQSATQSTQSSRGGPMFENVLPRLEPLTKAALTGVPEAQAASTTAPSEAAPARVAPQSTNEGYALADVIAQIGAVREAAGAPVAVPQKTSTQAASDSEGGFTKVLKSVFGVAPILGGLIDLFSGSEEPPPLLKYALPPSIQFQGAETRDGITSLDYNQSGTVRAYTPTPADVRTSESMTPQITVNVQAMDARSFLDRSSDIALAVRDAMLNLNSINDVVNDL